VTGGSSTKHSSTIAVVQQQQYSGRTG
jgi:hypothetical protein